MVVLVSAKPPSALKGENFVIEFAGRVMYLFCTLPSLGGLPRLTRKIFSL